MRDNLMCSTRLFHLGEQKSTQRTEQLITEIGLSEYADAKATAATQVCVSGCRWPLPLFTTRSCSS